MNKILIERKRGKITRVLAYVGIISILLTPVMIWQMHKVGELALRCINNNLVISKTK